MRSKVLETGFIYKKADSYNYVFSERDKVGNDNRGFIKSLLGILYFFTLVTSLVLLLSK